MAPPPAGTSPELLRGGCFATECAGFRSRVRGHVSVLQYWLTQSPGQYPIPFHGLFMLLQCASRCPQSFLCVPPRHVSFVSTSASSFSESSSFGIATRFYEVRCPYMPSLIHSSYMSKVSPSHLPLPFPVSLPRHTTPFLLHIMPLYPNTYHL